MLRRHLFQILNNSPFFRDDVFLKDDFGSSFFEHEEEGKKIEENSLLKIKNFNQWKKWLASIPNDTIFLIYIKGRESLRINSLLEKWQNNYKKIIMIQISIEDISFDKDFIKFFLGRMKISIEKTSMFLLVKKISLKEGTSIQEIFRTKVDDNLKILKLVELMKYENGPILEKSNLISDVISISEDGLTATFIGLKEKPKIIFCNVSMALINYFEITVKNTGTECVIGIGIGLKQGEKLYQGMPGWNNGFGYHGDDGNIFCPFWEKGKNYGPTWENGSVVGCGYSSVNNCLFFTINGKFIKYAFKLQKSIEEYYPFIGLGSPGASISINFKPKSIPSEADKFVEKNDKKPISKKLLSRDQDSPKEVKSVPVKIAPPPPSPKLENVSEKDSGELNNIEISLISLGEGNYGKVYQGKWLKSVVVALKKLKIDDKHEIKNEINTLKSLRHPHIVEYLGFYSEKNDIYLVTEFFPLGDLKSFLNSQSDLFTIEIKKKIAKDAASGMIYLSSKKIVHRDLAARNLLVF
jgi:hypothetical protein